MNRHMSDTLTAIADALRRQPAHSPTDLAALHLVRAAASLLIDDRPIADEWHVLVHDLFRSIERPRPLTRVQALTLSELEGEIWDLWKRTHVRGPDGFITHLSDVPPEAIALRSELDAELSLRLRSTAQEGSDGAAADTATRRPMASPEVLS